MSLKYKVDSVPEGLEDHYKETDDGHFVLNVEGVVEETALEQLKSQFEETKQKAEEKDNKLKEFREHNISLRKQLEQSSGSNGNIEELIEEALNPVRSKLKEREQERDQLQSQLEEVVLSDRVKDVAIRHGVFESALPDVVTRARNVFTVKDGKPVPSDQKMRDENGELLNPETWLKKLQDDAPHLFKPSTGSGATRPAGSVKAGDTKLTGTQRIANALNAKTTSTKKVM